jgi:hypothetical protein
MGDIFNASVPEIITFLTVFCGMIGLGVIIYMILSKKYTLHQVFPMIAITSVLIVVGNGKGLELWYQDGDTSAGAIVAELADELGRVQNSVADLGEALKGLDARMEQVGVDAAALEEIRGDVKTLAEKAAAGDATDARISALVDSLDLLSPESRRVTRELNEMYQDIIESAEIFQAQFIAFQEEFNFLRRYKSRQYASLNLDNNISVYDNISLWNKAPQWQFTGTENFIIQDAEPLSKSLMEQRLFARICVPHGFVAETDTDEFPAFKVYNIMRPQDAEQ